MYRSYLFLFFHSLKKMKSPILLLHSKDDHLVPIEIAQGVLVPLKSMSTHFSNLNGLDVLANSIFCCLCSSLPVVRGSSERPECRASQTGDIWRFSGLSAQRLIQRPPSARHLKVSTLLTDNTWFNYILACQNNAHSITLFYIISPLQKFCGQFVRRERREADFTESLLFNYITNIKLYIF